MYNALCCDISIVVFPMFVEKFPPWTVHTLEGMSSEIITHRLNHISWGTVGGADPENNSTLRKVQVRATLLST